MFNNFDYLFTLPKILQEIVNKRLMHAKKYGKEVFMGMIIFFFAIFDHC